MSAATKLSFAEALEIARALHAEISPVVARAKVVGSLRRQRAEVGDIELLVEPRTIASNLFGELAPDLASIQHAVSGWGDIQKSGEKYAQVQRRDGVVIDVFICTPPAHWGSLLAIRTGPAELGQHAVTQMRRRGLVHRAGHVETERGRLIPTPEEVHFFRAAGLPCLPPAKRDVATRTPECYRSTAPLCVPCGTTLEDHARLYGSPLCSSCDLASRRGE